MSTWYYQTVLFQLYVEVDEELKVVVTFHLSVGQNHKLLPKGSLDFFEVEIGPTKDRSPMVNWTGKVHQKLSIWRLKDEKDRNWSIRIGHMVDKDKGGIALAHEK